MVCRRCETPPSRTVWITNAGLAEVLEHLRPTRPLELSIHRDLSAPPLHKSHARPNLWPRRVLRLSTSTYSPDYPAVSFQIPPHVHHHLEALGFAASPPQCDRSRGSVVWSTTVTSITRELQPNRTGQPEETGSRTNQRVIPSELDTRQVILVEITLSPIETTDNEGSMVLGTRMDVDVGISITHTVRWYKLSDPHGSPVHTITGVADVRKGRFDQIRPTTLLLEAEFDILTPCDPFLGSEAEGTVPEPMKIARLLRVKLGMPWGEAEMRSGDMLWLSIEMSEDYTVRSNNRRARTSGRCPCTVQYSRVDSEPFPIPALSVPPSDVPSNIVDKPFVSFGYSVGEEPSDSDATKVQDDDRGMVC
ncbi:hypothetical protein C8Q77DRAFT_720347 [Trametes polyzona]|nr:hypothetical protein C8Q77DRAFT_720347 [Trametes polyzona]